MCRGSYWVPPAHGGRWSSRLDAVLHAIAFSLDDDRFRVMQQTIEDSRSKGTYFRKQVAW